MSDLIYYRDRAPRPTKPIDDGGGLPGFGLIAGLVALCLGAVAHRIRRS